ncbi:MAG: hypothetical protein HQM14_14285 [SAR324 cluster bacterium]|nr:hypothetical protein [SAR324 cluster bacterium]
MGNAKVSSIQARFLQADIENIYWLMQGYLLDESEECKSRIKIYTEETGSLDYLVFEKFPMPKGYKKSHEHIMAIINKYPDFPPYGIFIDERSPNVPKIEKILKQHILESDVGDAIAKDQHQTGYKWLCYHYNRNEWAFYPNDLSRGDNLGKFFLNLYLVLDGQL